MSKIEKAKQIVHANPNANRSQLIELFMRELSMSKAGATTYYYNATAGTREPSTRAKNQAAKAVVVENAAAAARPRTAAQIMKAAEKAAKQKQSAAETAVKQAAKEAFSKKTRQELKEFVDNIEEYNFPNGTLSDEQNAIKEKNLQTMKEVSAKRKGGNYIVV